MKSKNDILLRLKANVIIDYLKKYAEKTNKILFEQSACSTQNYIRFSHKLLDEKFNPTKNNKGYFKNGHYVYFEIKPEEKKWYLYLNISKKDLLYNAELNFEKIKHNVTEDHDEYATFFKKELSDILDDVKIAIEKIDYFLENEMDQRIAQALNEENKKLREEPKIIYEVDYYIEGALHEVFNNKYERNQEARIKCIEHYGAKCQICGFDFSKVYGEEFLGKIEVHHRVPLHEIGKSHVVDPIKDLIPVCSNCHLILHSKKDGTYKVEEVTQLINKRKEK